MKNMLIHIAIYLVLEGGKRRVGGLFNVELFYVT